MNMSALDTAVMDPAPPPPAAGGGCPPPVPQVKACSTLSSTLLASWPSSAQVTVAALVAGVVILLAIHTYAGLRAGTRPSERIDSDGPIYRLDLNRARAAELTQVDGIGAKLAQRIVEHRRLNGPFQSIDELRHVSGVGPKTLERVRAWVCVEPQVSGLAEPAKAPARPIVFGRVASPLPANAAPSSARPGRRTKEASLTGPPINVNEASAAELQRLPRIGPVLSQRIVAERAREPFRSIEELRRVKGIGPKTLETLRPYVTVGSPSSSIATAEP